MGNKDFYLGLDLGTASVGWAATDTQYNLLRAKGKDLWGVRLFNEASTAAERRQKRVSRRRNEREKARKAILKDIFADAINEVDPAFYLRLKESFLKIEDRSDGNSQKYSLFNDPGFTDKEYHEKYKTIFHLRKDLLHSDKAFDVRLVFLAIYNMFEHRGHFLNSSLDPEKNETHFKEAYMELAEALNDFDIALPSYPDLDRVEKILSDRNKSRSVICKELAEYLNISKDKSDLFSIVKLICGLKVKIRDLGDFDKLSEDDEKRGKGFGFREANYEEESAEIHDIIGDEWFDLIEKIKNVHDTGLLSSIMLGCEYLSDARVKIYEQHGDDLRQLKRVLSQYDKSSYIKIFRKISDASYSAYVGSVNSYGRSIRRKAEIKNRGKAELYKTILKALESVPADDPDRTDIKNKIAAETFLEKQLTNQNGVIPNQVHSRELRKILRNAEKYLPFLSEKDDSGLSNSEKIIALFEFRIPYYVGPLGQSVNEKGGNNCWAVRKESGQVLPWNFKDKIDEAASAELFIKRMLRRCTYLNDEVTLPKNSLLYEKFMVLNEINAISINGKRLESDVKRSLYKDLFMSGKKVSKAKIKEYLVSINKMDPRSEIAGIDVTCNQSLTSVAKFKPVFGESFEEDREMIEDIIFWGTIYSGDKEFIRSKIEDKYPDVLSESQMKRILGYRFSGWGRLSREFLETMGTSKETGEINSIIGFLWDHQVTLMELMSSDFTFKEEIGSRVKNAMKPLNEWSVEDLDELYLSPSVKRMTWQAMKIVEELTRVLGKQPKRIFVEMTRGDGEKKRTTSRKDKLIGLYKNIGKEGDSWRKELEKLPDQTFKKRKLYLYYMQKGKCMYTGETIDLSRLMDDNLYDLDHIYPQHYIKDDSIENNLVLVKKQKNAEKLDMPVTAEIQKKMYSFWLELKTSGFVNDEKFTRLTRNNRVFTIDEKAGFINRQLVETGQASKAITQILKQSMGNSSEVVFSKARLVSDFRDTFDIPKARSLNDLHHAQDAYLNIVVGNCYFVKFTNNPLNFLKNAEKDPEAEDLKYHLGRFFFKDIKNINETAWLSGNSQNPTIDTVMRTVNRLTALVTFKVEEGHGEFFKETVISHDEAKEGSYIGVKTRNSPLRKVTEYGGKTSVSTLGYALVEYKEKNKQIKLLRDLPVLLGDSRSLTDQCVYEYIKNSLIREGKLKEAESLRLCERFIPKQSLVKVNGYHYYLGGRTGDQIYLINAVQLKLQKQWVKYIHKIEKANAKEDYDETDSNRCKLITKEKNLQLYKYLIGKLKKPPYSNRLTPITDTLENGIQAFETISEAQQCKLLEGIILNITKTKKVDLKLIGGSPNSGICHGSVKVSNYSEYKIIYTSGTGLFVYERDLLKL